MGRFGEEISMKVKKNFRVTCFLLTTGLWSSLCVAQTSGRTAAVNLNPDRPVAISPTNVDLRALRGQMETFQKLVNRSIQENFETPFALLQDTKGIYLPGYGVAFHLEVNLHPLRTIYPFDTRPYTAEELQKAKQSKLNRIRDLKTQLSNLLMAHGSDLSAMAPEENIAIVANLFNLPSEDPDLPAQLVMTINRRLLLDARTQRLTAEEFQKAGSSLVF